MTLRLVVAAAAVAFLSSMQIAHAAEMAPEDDAATAPDEDPLVEGATLDDFFADPDADVGGQPAEDSGTGATLTAEEAQERLDAIMGSDYVQAKIAGIEDMYQNLTEMAGRISDDPDMVEMLANLTTEEREWFDKVMDPKVEEKMWEVLQARGTKRNMMDLMLSALQDGGDKKMDNYDMTYTEAADFIEKIYDHMEDTGDFDDGRPIDPAVQDELQAAGKITREEFPGSESAADSAEGSVEDSLAHGGEL